MDIPTLVDRFAMRPHPEGGHFVEVYRSADGIPASALPAAFGGSRPFATDILYLLGAGERSHWHRIRQDELWHFHAGGALRLVHINARGEWVETRLGGDFAAGDVPQAVMPAGCWFAATPAPGVDYVLVGCTVAPGFTFHDFELADPDRLLAQYPALADRLPEFLPSRAP